MKESAEILNKLFSSPHRVKILRFFFSNPEGLFSVKELSQRVKVNASVLRREILILSKIGFVKSAKKDKNEKWSSNHLFLFFKPLKNLILSAFPVSKSGLLEKLKRVGRLKIIILSGILIKEENDSKTDILIVGDNLNKNSISRVLKGVEAEMGKEISYVIMNVGEFVYRRDIRDKFVREILESPHEVILDKLKIF